MKNLHSPILKLRFFPSQGTGRKHAVLSKEGHVTVCLTLPLHPGLSAMRREVLTGWSPTSGAGQFWLADASTEAAVFHLPGFMAHTVTDKGEQTSCL